MKVIVQKFGGTSVQSERHRDRVAELVGRAIEMGYRPVVVVSAMGRQGAPYATDTLLSLVDPSALAPAHLDLLLACGEVIAASVLVSCLVRRGLPAVPVTGGEAGIVTDEEYGQARILEVDPAPLEALLAQNRVPVVAGFQGRTRSGHITTLGRGGSDTTAAALGAALKAEVVDIFTDVEGLMTADPRIVENAHRVPAADYDEVLQMATLGARVMHPRAVEIARQFAVPLRIRSTFSDADGTLVGAGTRALDTWAHRDPASAVTGITALADLTQILAVRRGDPGGDWAWRLFEALAAAGISVDLINVFPDSAYFCVPASLAGPAEAVVAQQNLACRVEGERAKVSVVGSAIHGLPGVMAQVLGALAEAGIEVLQTADSHSTISCLVRREEMERAVRAMHARFGL
jgi:aspartate kinase